MTSRNAFRKIGLIGRTSIVGIEEPISNLLGFLLSQDCEIILDTETATLVKTDQYKIVNKHDLAKQVDLIIVVGGDGSLLNAAHFAAPCKTPVLGVNRGTLGFLTDINPEHLEPIANILKGDYSEESRFMLQAHVPIKPTSKEIVSALNDVVLSPGDKTRMIKFEVLINDQFVYNLRADGLIIATPTGSTAYALSGGGPIIHPKVNAIVLVPMSPHTLSSRPIVVDAESKIDIIISDENPCAPHLSCDGQEQLLVEPGSKITISKSNHQLRLIHLTSYTYYETLRTKLHWKG